MLRKLFALMIFGLAKIRGALWVIIQLLTFWNSFKKNGKDGPGDDLADIRRDQKMGKKKGAEPDD